MKHKITLVETQCGKCESLDHHYCLAFEEDLPEYGLISFAENCKRFEQK